MSSTGKIPQSGLYLDWCSEKAAKYACEHYHYSEVIPKGKRARIGVWEDGDFIGAVLYGAGANTNIGSSFGLDQTEACELTRVALREHENHVTRVLSISRKLITKQHPGLRVIISYADPKENHNGAIYQADNWHYMGVTDSRDYLIINGKTYHPMSAYKNWGTSSKTKLQKAYPDLDVSSVKRPGKYKYVYPLDEEIDQKAQERSKPYP